MRWRSTWTVEGQWRSATNTGQVGWSSSRRPRLACSTLARLAHSHCQNTRRCPPRRHRQHPGTAPGGCSQDVHVVQIGRAHRRGSGFRRGRHRRLGQQSGRAAGFLDLDAPAQSVERVAGGRRYSRQARPRRDPARCHRLAAARRERPCFPGQVPDGGARHDRSVALIGDQAQDVPALDMLDTGAMAAGDSRVPGPGRPQRGPLGRGPGAAAAQRE